MSGTEWATTTARIEQAVTILEREHPMTIRQLFYRLVSIALIVNCLEHYKRVSRDMTKARLSGRVPWDWIVDRSRPTYEPTMWENLPEYAEAVLRGYRKSYWADQPEHVLLWSEKDAVIGSILELTDELGITVQATRGFNSSTRVRQAAEDLAAIRKPTTVFYIAVAP